VVVDCSGFSETLFESELFGYEKGAFTGAQTRKIGLVETANGGTLFLDEIGDVPLAMQVKLLRLIETGTFRRVGGVEIQSSDFRLVAATHQPLERMVADGRFRADLYYRICGFPIHLPPLRERIDDIALLVESILQRGASVGGSRVRVAPDAIALLQAHDWPGNIRELRNVLERARLFSEEGEIRASHLALHGAGAGAPPTPLAVPIQAVAPTPAPALRARTRLSPAELADTLRSFQGTRRELAEHLGWTQRTLYRRLREAGLT
jgi:DNA-binding NtrC family response regulator